MKNLEFLIFFIKCKCKSDKIYDSTSTPNTPSDRQRNIDFSNDIFSTLKHTHSCTCMHYRTIFSSSSAF